MSEVAKVANKGEVAVFDAAKYQIKQRLVVPTISIAEMNQGDSLYIRAESDIIKTKTENPKPGESDELHVLQVTNLETGEFGQIVLPHVMLRGFVQASQDEPLKGRLFAAQKGEKRGRTNLWNLVEMMEG